MTDKINAVMNLVETVRNEACVSALAEAILLAAKLREDSYDHVAAESVSGIFVDYSQFYGVTLQHAADLAAERVARIELAFPVYLLLLSHWNNALEWATANAPSTKAKA